MKRIATTLLKAGQGVDWLRVSLVAVLAWGALMAAVLVGVYFFAERPLEEVLQPLCLSAFYGVLTHATSEMELSFRFRVAMAILLVGLLNSLRWIAQTLFISQVILLVIALVTLFYGLHTPPAKKESSRRDVF